MYIADACECCKTPPVMEWKVHSVACSQVNKNVKRGSESEGHIATKVSSCCYEICYQNLFVKMDVD